MILSIVLPLSEPILIFTVIITIVLLAPILLKRLNIPDIIGLIIAGVIIGPNGFNILSPQIGLSIFATIGLLYLMFIAGLEVDLNDFFRRRREGSLFGILTFLIPFIPALIIFYYLLNYKIESAILVSTMLASHTLVSYPILGRFNIINHRIVTITIAGTIIADTSVLIILGVVSNSIQGDLSLLFWGQTILFFALFFFFTLKIIPLIAKWFFAYCSEDNGLQYVFVLAAIFISATVAEALKIEPLIGAFFCGLSLNRLIPRGEVLANRILFVGNALFIPFFLISIGMLVNTNVLINDHGSWLIIGILTLLALGGKYFAAWIMQKVYRFNSISRNLIFGLSSARAASAIAIMIVGAEFNLVDERLLNSTIFLILVTCVVSTLVTQRAGFKISSLNKSNSSEDLTENNKLMVAVGNPDNIEHLIGLSLMINNNGDKEPILPITILPKGKHSAESLNQHQEIIQDKIDEVDEKSISEELVTRIDSNVVSGLVTALREFEADRLIVGWNSKTTPIDRLFGGLLNNLIKRTNKMILVSKLLNNIKEVANLQIFLPENIQSEKGFHDLLSLLNTLRLNLDRRMIIYSNRKTLDSMNTARDIKNNDVIMIETQLDEDFFKKLSEGPLGPNDLLCFVKARKKTITHSKLIENYPKIINQYFNDHNLIMVFPEQIIIPRGISQLYNMNN